MLKWASKSTLSSEDGCGYVAHGNTTAHEDNYSGSHQSRESTHKNGLSLLTSRKSKHIANTNTHQELLKRPYTSHGDLRSGRENDKHHVSQLSGDQIIQADCYSEHIDKTDGSTFLDMDETLPNVDNRFMKIGLTNTLPFSYTDPVSTNVAGHSYLQRITRPRIQGDCYEQRREHEGGLVHSGQPNHRDTVYELINKLESYSNTNHTDLVENKKDVPKVRDFYPTPDYPAFEPSTLNDIDINDKCKSTPNSPAQMYGLNLQGNRNLKSVPTSPVGKAGSGSFFKRLRSKSVTRTGSPQSSTSSLGGSKWDIISKVKRILRTPRSKGSVNRSVSQPSSPKMSLADDDQEDPEKYSLEGEEVANGRKGSISTRLTRRIRSKRSERRQTSSGLNIGSSLGFSSVDNEKNNDVFQSNFDFPQEGRNNRFTSITNYSDDIPSFVGMDLSDQQTPAITFETFKPLVSETGVKRKEFTVHSSPIITREHTSLKLTKHSEDLVQHRGTSDAITRQNSSECGGLLQDQNRTTGVIDCSMGTDKIMDTFDPGSFVSKQANSDRSNGLGLYHLLIDTKETKPLQNENDFDKENELIHNETYFDKETEPIHNESDFDEEIKPIHNENDFDKEIKPLQNETYFDKENETIHNETDFDEESQQSFVDNVADVVSSICDTLCPSKLESSSHDTQSIKETVAHHSDGSESIHVLEDAPSLSHCLGQNSQHYEPIETIDVDIDLSQSSPCGYPLKKTLDTPTDVTSTDVSQNFNHSPVEHSDLLNGISLGSPQPSSGLSAFSGLDTNSSPAQVSNTNSLTSLLKFGESLGADFDQDDDSVVLQRHDVSEENGVGTVFDVGKDYHGVALNEPIQDVVPEKESEIYYSDMTNSFDTIKYVANSVTKRSNEVSENEMISSSGFTWVLSNSGVVVAVKKNEEDSCLGKQILKATKYDTEGVSNTISSHNKSREKFEMKQNTDTSGSFSFDSTRSTTPFNIMIKETKTKVDSQDMPELDDSRKLKTRNNNNGQHHKKRTSLIEAVDQADLITNVVGGENEKENDWFLKSPNTSYSTQVVIGMVKQDIKEQESSDESLCCSPIRVRSIVNQLEERIKNKESQNMCKTDHRTSRSQGINGKIEKSSSPTKSKNGDIMERDHFLKSISRKKHEVLCLEVTNVVQKNVSPQKYEDDVSSLSSEVSRATNSVTDCSSILEDESMCGSALASSSLSDIIADSNSDIHNPNVEHVPIYDNRIDKNIEDQSDPFRDDVNAKQFSAQDPLSSPVFNDSIGVISESPKSLTSQDLHGVEQKLDSTDEDIFNDKGLTDVTPHCPLVDTSNSTLDTKQYHETLDEQDAAIQRVSAYTCKVVNATTQPLTKPGSILSSASKPPSPIKKTVSFKLDMTPSSSSDDAAVCEELQEQKKDKIIPIDNVAKELDVVSPNDASISDQPLSVEDNCVISTKSSSASPVKNYSVGSCDDVSLSWCGFESPEVDGEIPSESVHPPIVNVQTGDTHNTFTGDRFGRAKTVEPLLERIDENSLEELEQCNFSTSAERYNSGKLSENSPPKIKHHGNRKNQKNDCKQTNAPQTDELNSLLSKPHSSTSVVEDTLSDLDPDSDTSDSIFGITDSNSKINTYNVKQTANITAQKSPSPVTESKDDNIDELVKDVGDSSALTDLVNQVNDSIMSSCSSTLHSPLLAERLKSPKRKQNDASIQTNPSQLPFWERMNLQGGMLTLQKNEKHSPVNNTLNRTKETTTSHYNKFQNRPKKMINLSLEISEGKIVTKKQPVVENKNNFKTAKMFGQAKRNAINNRSFVLSTKRGKNIICSDHNTKESNNKISGGYRGPLNSEARLNLRRGVSSTTFSQQSNKPNTNVTVDIRKNPKKIANNAVNNIKDSLLPHRRLRQLNQKNECKDSQDMQSRPSLPTKDDTSAQLPPKVTGISYKQECSQTDAERREMAQASTQTNFLRRDSTVESVITFKTKPSPNRALDEQMKDSTDTDEDTSDASPTDKTYIHETVKPSISKPVPIYERQSLTPDNLEKNRRLEQHDVTVCHQSQKELKMSNKKFRSTYTKSQSPRNHNITQSPRNHNITQSPRNLNISESPHNLNISESLRNPNFSESLCNLNISEYPRNLNISESPSLCNTLSDSCRGLDACLLSMHTNSSKARHRTLISPNEVRALKLKNHDSNEIQTLSLNEVRAFKLHTDDSNETRQIPCPFCHLPKQRSRQLGPHNKDVPCEEPITRDRSTLHTSAPRVRDRSTLHTSAPRVQEENDCVTTERVGEEALRQSPRQVYRHPNSCSTQEGESGEWLMIATFFLFQILLHWLHSSSK